MKLPAESKPVIKIEAVQDTQIPALPSPTRAAAKPKHRKSADPASAGKPSKKRRRSSTESGFIKKLAVSAELDTTPETRYQELIASCTPEATWQEAQRRYEASRPRSDDIAQPLAKRASRTVTDYPWASTVSGTYQPLSLSTSAISDFMSAHMSDCAVGYSSSGAWEAYYMGERIWPVDENSFGSVIMNWRA